VIRLDQRNAFNNTSRRALLTELFKRATLTPLFRLMHYVYAQPSLLIMRSRSGDVAAVFLSQEGLRQGCRAGSFGYALATLSTLVALSSEYPGVNVNAILDDVTLVGSPASVSRAFALSGTAQAKQAGP
jgi:hypothetical protein